MGSHDVVVEIQDGNIPIGRWRGQRVGAHFQAVANDQPTGFLHAENPIDGNAVAMQQISGG